MITAETYDMWAWIFAVIAIIGILMWCWADIYYDRMKRIPWFYHVFGLVGVAFLIIALTMLWQVLQQPFDI